MEVSVIFNADTGQYEAKLAGMDAKTAKSAQAVADAKNKILAYHREQIESAVALGKSAEDLERIQSKSAAAMANVTESNANKMIASLDRLIARHKAMRAEMDTSLKLPPVPSEGGLGNVPNRLKTSTVLRVSEASTSIRGAEAFISSVPALASLTDAVFPVAAAASFLFVVGKGYQELKKMYDEAKQVPSAIAEGFAAISRPLNENFDAVQQNNDELQALIDKIEHKPVNNLALALDDDQKRIDQLANSARSATDAINKLLKDQSVGELAHLFMGEATTGDVSQEIKKRFSDITAAQNEDEKKFRYADVTARGIADPKAREGAEKKAQADQEARRAAIDKQLDSLQSYIRDTRAYVNGSHAYTNADGIRPLGPDGRVANVPGDKSAYNNLLNGAEDIADAMQLQRRADAANVVLTGKAKGLQSGRDGADKAAELQMKSIEEADAKLKAMFATDHASMLGAQVAFWQAMANSAKILPANQARVLDEYASAEEAYMRGLNEAARQGVAEQKQQTAEQQKEQHDSWDKDFQDWTAAGQRSAQAVADFWAIRALEADRGSQNEVDALKKSNDAYREVLREREQLDQANKRLALGMSQNDATVAQAQLQVAVSTGRISPRDAALEQQRIHQQESGARVSALQQDYDRRVAQDQKIGTDSNQPDYVSAETLSALAALNKAKAEQMAQDQVDAARVAATGWKDSLTDAIDQWAQHAKDTAGQVAQLFDQTISETNNNLADLMSGEYKKGDFAKEGHDLAKTVSVDALQHAEASILGGFGFGKGKPDGTANNPFHVVLGGQNSDSDSSSGGLMNIFRGIFKSGTKSDSGDDEDGSGLASLFGSFGSSDSGSSIGDAVSGGTSDMLSGALDFLGGMALGGDVPDSGIYDVGEMGREKVFLPAGSKVVPNNQLAGDTHIHIDARDSTDPAQTEARLHRAIQSYIPGIVGASLAAGREQRRRQPTTKR